jgi:CheY-like chemotaxis protein
MKGRVLLADNDATLCDIYHQYFRSCGYLVETAVNGVECLHKFRQFLPDVLVLEWDMPWGGGCGVLARLHEEYPALPVHVIVVTANPADQQLTAPLSERVVGYLTKPFHLATLRDYLGQAAMASESMH